ncbi:SDR family NAD(P)-dependent oxidoreductase [Nocardia sp. CA-129566]|uniref:SDR family NAD(P)-dependent oxidoreductase n=1 Tax=Nocardia sp. CA-129566 TaxID=3239976 RepID=UPI003D96DE9A
MSMFEKFAQQANNVLIKPRRLPAPWVPSLADRVAGRTVLITGASSGIGRALAEAVAAAGATTLVVARRADELEVLVREIGARGGVAYAIAGDLSTEESIDAVADRVLAEFGAPEILVNNAGRSIRRSVANSERRLHDYERTMRVNYLGAVGLTLRLLPGMRARGSGYVLASSSIGVQANLPRFSAYVASKAALDAFMRVAAVECLSDGVRFGTVHLPLVDTDMIGPTGWGGFTPLAVDEAVALLIDALRRQPDHVGVPLGALAATGGQLMPRTARLLLHYFHRMLPESAAAKGIRPDDPSIASDHGGNLNSTSVVRPDPRGASMPADVRAAADHARIES